MEILKLDNQICFPLYALSRKVICYYQPMLDELNLTYPQYLVMLLLWERKTLSVKELGQHLLLDSGTLTPLLKRLEERGLVTRTRSKEDERVVLIALTSEGKDLKKQAKKVPAQLLDSLGVDEKQLQRLKMQLTEMLDGIIAKEKEGQ
ncbi:MarR family winged helix-turn-helix transcriptional regulator [uncultured Chitinophaga sp.]|uniref:MarR family winged helix-turn-helix transcriptional regulator n=1 Tax=uncultured Chitinophaga sp. TaxID=339340 RepID=UPI0025F7B710|nr:MarR family transcriptional regulator [uncultured Chitinophaga sp.]